MNKNIAKELNHFSLPLVANNFSILISSLLAAIIGRISINAIAATEVVNTFIYSLIGILEDMTVYLLIFIPLEFDYPIQKCLKIFLSQLFY